MTINGLHVAIEDREIGTLRPLLWSIVLNKENEYSIKKIIKLGLRFIMIYDLDGNLLHDHKSLLFWHGASHGGVAPLRVV